MKRNLRFWTRYTWENVAVELLIVGIFLLVNLLSGDLVWTKGISGWTNLLALLPFHLMMAAALCIVIVAPGNQMIYVPLLIAYGEPRKNVFWGMQYYRFLVITVTSAVSALFWRLVPCDISDAGLQCLPVMITGLVIASAFGDLVGTAYVRWKWLGLVVIALSFGLFGGLFGWMVNAGKFDIAALPLVALGLTNLHLSWRMTVLAAVLLAVDLGLQWLLLRRREVKF